jgi:hypothetical protein
LIVSTSQHCNTSDDVGDLAARAASDANREFPLADELLGGNDHRVECVLEAP